MAVGAVTLLAVGAAFLAGGMIISFREWGQSSLHALGRFGQPFSNFGDLDDVPPDQLSALVLMCRRLNWMR
jgi:hypothetical protein